MAPMEMQVLATSRMRAAVDYKHYARILVYYSAPTELTLKFTKSLQYWALSLKKSVNALELSNRVIIVE